MHVVQITIPITFCIAIRNVFRNVILAHVNTTYIMMVAIFTIGLNKIHVAPTKDIFLVFLTLCIVSVYAWEHFGNV